MVTLCKCGEQMDLVDKYCDGVNRREFLYICDCGKKATRTQIFDKHGDITKEFVEYQ